jgi:hypothetical protein
MSGQYFLFGHLYDMKAQRDHRGAQGHTRADRLCIPASPMR